MTAKQKMSRRKLHTEFGRYGWRMDGGRFYTVESIAGEVRPEIAKSESSAGVSKVYMLKDITPQNMIRLYDAWDGRPRGKWR